MLHYARYACADRVSALRIYPMGAVRSLPTSVLVIACFSRHDQALNWARERLEDAYGPIALTSPDLPFRHTSYYEPSMGAGLIKRFFAFERLPSPHELSDIKLRTNKLEEELAASGLFAERRPLNLDPGLLQLGKFMLASTKDNAHRIYLRDGIYAEVTLRFQGKKYEPWPWTYADYREELVQSFLLQVRETFRDELAN